MNIENSQMTKKTQGVNDGGKSKGGGGIHLIHH